MTVLILNLHGTHCDLSCPSKKSILNLKCFLDIYKYNAAPTNPKYRRLIFREFQSPELFHVNLKLFTQFHDFSLKGLFFPKWESKNRFICASLRPIVL